MRRTYESYDSWSNERGMRRNPHFRAFYLKEKTLWDDKNFLQCVGGFLNHNSFFIYAILDLFIFTF